MNGDAGGVREAYNAESGFVFVVGGDGIILYRGFWDEIPIRAALDEGLADLPPVSAAPEVPMAGNRFDGGHPNPFNPTTRLAFRAASGVGEQPAHLEIADLRGMVLRVLVDEPVAPGRDYEAVWDGCDGSGRPVASGVYLARLSIGGWRATRSLTLVK